jgi:uncharacterized protein YacL
VVGLLLGLLMGLLLGLPLSAFPDPLGTWLPLAVSLGLGLGMLGLTVAKREDLIIAAEAIGIVRRPVPEGDRGRTTGDPHIVVDTSAIIDGRIAEIVDSGFIYGTLVVPKFVLDELQHIADSSTRSVATAAGAASRSWRRCRRTHRRRSRSSTSRCPTSPRSTRSSSPWPGSARRPS